ncbi:hypothetical protein EYF80_045552 [Liparis tanakae]|uniref:Uncharacterized protein n=1 Tax=Liparis tanakae TaxID=230148 RepID=A0A4Z2FSY2_9TELE|nr:hypothetical protein EYF80_045552 [Liparis tanakae]
MNALRVTQGDAPEGFLHHFLLRLPTQSRQFHQGNPMSTHLSLVLNTLCANAEWAEPDKELLEKKSDKSMPKYAKA